MKKHLVPFVFGVGVLILFGCATAKDVQRATDLIRTDNQLTRLLVEVRPKDQEGSATYLIGIATHAQTEAESLEGLRGKQADAIAYYRIAATAYWKSGAPEVVDDLFEATLNGMNLCAELKEGGPDRDCMFLQLVIPFAGLESLANGVNLKDTLGKIDFYDDKDTGSETEMMRNAFGDLEKARALIKKIYQFETDDRLKKHPAMRDYYCTNVEKARNYHIGHTGELIGKVNDYDQRPALQDASPLGITIEQARALNTIGQISEMYMGEPAGELKIDDDRYPKICRP
ncbi:hypothetical protein DSCW_54800 [Desulfosarcina widdelii]|uniref:Lipoprotein n=1 Tax=Desulfosarcina widdelii TaxID=947919 RepID=A0A5K7ZEB6_9BACT|nr:hypothetical protein [Desulfosarcina widdelii]BBO78063.1 hypothetical protein DSCW_54800 [Desulfosarcina widdelii]